MLVSLTKIRKRLIFTEIIGPVDLACKGPFGSGREIEIRSLESQKGCFVCVLKSKNGL